MPKCKGSISSSRRSGRGRAEAKSFKKIMRKTCLELMTVPADFVRDYGNEFTKHSFFSYDGGKANWIVNVNVRVKPDSVHVTFGSGWRNFAEFHHIAPGDYLKFKLVTKSYFDVKKIA